MKASHKFFLRIFLVLLTFYLLGKVFTDISIYIAISLIFTTLLLPLTERLVHTSFFGYQVSRSFAAFLSFLVLISGFSVFISLFIPLIEEQINTIAAIDSGNFDSQVKNIVSNVEVKLLDYHIIDNKGDLWKELEEVKESFFHQMKFNHIFSVVFSLTGSLLVGIIAIVFMTFFFLREKGKLRQTFLKLVPNQYFEFSVTAYHKIQSLLVGYLTGILIQMFIIFTLTSLGLSIVGVKYAITIGFFTAIANLIPYFGPFLGATFGIVVGLSTSSVLGREVGDYMFFIIKILSVFAVVQLTDNVLVQPIIFSKSVKAHPLEIFVIIFAGANIGGIAGMVCAIPFYTIIKVAIVELGFGYSQYHIFKN